MNHRRTVVIAVLAVSALAACSSPPPPRAPAQPSYGCCAESDLNRPYHPGQTMALHWTVRPVEPRPGESQPDPAQPVETRLQARLNGPFETDAAVMAAIQKDKVGEVTYTAATVRPAGLVDEVPTSLIVIKPDAKPGYYSLETSVSQGGGTVSGTTSVQVIAKT